MHIRGSEFRALGYDVDVPDGRGSDAAEGEASGLQSMAW